VRLLIITQPQDYHAHAVAWGIEQLGGNTSVWMPSDLPDQCFASIRINSAMTGADTTIQYNSIRTNLNEFDVIWNRRRGKPSAPAAASPHDIKVIESETSSHVDNILTILSRDSIFINDPARQYIADQKANQLQVALAVGFNIPDTLITNNFDEAVEFIRDNDPVVCKPYRPHLWRSEKKWYSQMSVIVPPIEKLEREAIEMCPIILQRQVKRKLEARIIVFGDKIFSAQVVGDLTESDLDSRLAIRQRKSEFRNITLPPSVESACRQYLGQLGLKFGAFDFIVSEDGDWVFLECNEAGQFLFLEDRLPNLNILDSFCKYLFSFSTMSPMCGEISLSTQLFEQSEWFANMEIMDSVHKLRQVNEFSILEA